MGGTRVVGEPAGPMSDVALDATLELAGVRLRLCADQACAPGLKRLLTAWSSAPCLDRRSTAQANVSAWLDEEQNEVVIVAGPLEERGEFDVKECHLAIERGIYAEVTRLVPEGRQMLHAGAVVRDGRGWLFVGPSGAGKSSLCLAAVRRGYSYLSDDVVVTDGSSVWGLARAIQFEPESPDRPLPSWLEQAELDAETYPRLTEEQDNSSLLFVPGPADTAEWVTASALHLVVLAPAPESRVQSLSPLAGLEQLVSASYHPHRLVDLGALSVPACRLEWQRPGGALTLLEEHFP